jgi:hypothetical protein
MPELDARVLGGAGLLAALGATAAYRSRATLPFKLAYAVAWPLLGTATILALQPTAPEMERRLSPEQAARVAEVRRNNAGTLAALQEQSKLR